MSARRRLVLRIAVALGLVTDVFVAVLAVFFQPLLGPLFDFPVHDPALATITGGETAVAACVYAVLLRDFERYRVFFYVIAFDQTIAVVLPALEIARGHVVATMKTIGPMPLNALLAAIYVFAARTIKPS